MSDSLLVSSAITNFAAVVDATTRYTVISGVCVNVATTEGETEVPVRYAGTFSNAFIYIPSNSASVTSTVTLQQSRADTALSISITSDQTGVKEDTSNTVSFAATDEAEWEITVPTESGTNTLNISLFGVQFTPDNASNCVKIFGGGRSRTINDASTTTFTRFQARGTEGTDESTVEWRIRQTFTASNFYTYVTSNARTTDTTLGTRKNSSAGGQSVTYTSGQTGAKEDTSNTDSLVAGDDFNYYVTTSTGTENLVCSVASVTLLNTGGFFPMLNGEAGSVPANNTRFWAVDGGDVGNATESMTQIYPQFTFTASELGSYVSANTGVSLATNITIRDNGGDSAVTVQYLAGQTGLKNDSSNTTEITAATDEINYEVTCLDLTGGVTVTWIGCLGSTAGVTPPSVTASYIPTLLFMGAG